MNIVNFLCRRLVLLSVVVFGVVACTSGPAPVGGGNNFSTLSGTAATGAPIVGQVVAIDSSTPPKIFTASQNPTAANLGVYIVDVTGGKAPFMLTVTGTAGGVSTTLNSIATATGQTVNITPLTDLIVAIAAGQPSGGGVSCTSNDPTVNAACAAALATAITGTNLSAAVTAVTNMIAPLNTTSINPLNDAFVANGTGMDAVLDSILVSAATSQSGTATVTLIGASTEQLGSVVMPPQLGGTPTVNSTPSLSVIAAARQYLKPAFGIMSPVDLSAYYASVVSTGTRGSITVNWTQSTGLVVNDVSITYTWTCSVGGAGGEFPYTINATPATGATTASIAAIPLGYTGGCPNDTSKPTAATINLQYSVDAGANQVVSQSYGTANGGSAPPVTTNALIGTWFATSGDGTTYTYRANGTYTGWVNCLGCGYEQGTYTWNSATGTFVGNDLTHNNLNQTSVQTVSGNTLTFTNGAGTTLGTFTRASPPSTIVGSWSPAGDTNIVVTFFANGDYMQSQSVVSGAANIVQPGLEHGTYTFNTTTGAFIVNCPTVDTNLQAGFSAPGGVQCTAGTTLGGTTATVNSNTLTFDGNTLTRIVAATNPLVGSWAFEGSTAIAIEFFANGDYMLSQATPADAYGTPGLEHGTYTWNSGTGAFSTGGCPPIDTNGEWGLSHPGGIGCAANTGKITVSGNKLTLIGDIEQIPHTLTRVTEPPVLPAQTFSEFSLPVGSGPFGIASGPDGNLWYTDNLKNRIGKMTQAGVVTTYPIPGVVTTSPTPGVGQNGSSPQTIINGPDGNMWFVEANSNNIARITTAGVITEYANTLGGWPQDLAVGPDGNIWFTDQGSSNANGAIGKLNITTGAITKYAIAANTQANLITLGPDGAMWFTQGIINSTLAGGSNIVARIDMAGVVTEITGSPSAIGITTGSDGNLWLTVPAPGAPFIAKMTTAGAITQYPVTTTATMPFFIKAAPDGNLWFGAPGGTSFGSWSTAGNLGRITTSGVITEFTLPTSSNVNPGIFTIGAVTVGSDGALWFVETQSGKIGRYHP